MDIYTLKADGLPGVVLLRRGREMHIPATEDNAHWREYQEWLAEGNTPDLAPPPVVLSAAEQAEFGLQATDVKMIRAIDWLLEKMVEKNVITVNEIPQALKDLYVQRKAQREA